MTSFWPGCNCCNPTTCAVVASTPFFDIDKWTEVSGTWSEVSDVLTGSDDGAIIVTDASTTGPQYVRLRFTGNAANQVFDVIFGCDAADSPDLYARITLGDSGVTDDCGTVQLFSGGVALEDARPVLGLCDGAPTRLTMCTDAGLTKWWIELRPVDPFSNIYPFADVTGKLLTNASGRMGLRLVDGQSGDIDFIADPGTANVWFNLFLAGSTTCKTCLICGTPIDEFIATTTPEDQTTCEFTVGGAFYFGLNVYGYSSVESNMPISEIDRDRGYGIEASGGALLSTTDDTVMEVSFDNGHHVARLTISARIAGTCGGFLSTTYHKDTLLEIEKDGVLLSSTTGCVGFNFSGAELFTFYINAGFCDGNVFAEAGVEVSAGLWFWNSSTLSVASAQTGDGSAHGASIVSGGYYGGNDGGISNFETIRCLNCDQCENCEDATADPTLLTWQAEIEATPSDEDGTYTVTGYPSGCNASGTGTPRCHLEFNRHGIKVFNTPASGGYSFQGTSSAPLVDCEGLVDAVININGSKVIVITVTVTQQGGGGNNETATVTYSATPPLGSNGFRLVHSGNNTAIIVSGDDAATVQSYLEALPSIGVGNVSVTGGTDGPWTVEFIGALANTNVADLTRLANITVFLTGTATVTSL